MQKINKEMASSEYKNKKFHSFSVLYETSQKEWYVIAGLSGRALVLLVSEGCLVVIVSKGF